MRQFQVELTWHDRLGLDKSRDPMSVADLLEVVSKMSLADRVIVAYDINRRDSMKSGRIYTFPELKDKFILDLADLSLTHNIILATAPDELETPSFHLPVVFFERSSDGQTNINGEVMDGFMAALER